MMATGAVRRIDDLGRITIPKEIRNKANLNECEAMEFFLDEDYNILLKKVNSKTKKEELQDAIHNYLSSEEEIDCSIYHILVGLQKALS